MTAIQSKAALLETISASRLQTFQQCRLKFFFRYVLKLKKPKPSVLHVGSVVHQILSHWNMARWKQIPLQAPQLKEQFEQHWDKESKEEPVKWSNNEEPEERTSSWSLLESYFSTSPIPPNEKPEAVEVSLEADLSKHGLPTLHGILDLVRKGGRIVEFKTAGQTPSAERIEHLHETQISCYGVLYREATGKQESGFEFHHLIKLKTPKIQITSLAPMTQQQETRLFRLMDSYLNCLEREDFYPSPNPMTCACCEFFRECRSWN